MSYQPGRVVRPLMLGLAMALGALAGGYGIAWAVTSLSTTAVSTDTLSATNLKVRDAAASPTGNIFEVANSIDSSRYFTVSSTSTHFTDGSAASPSLTFFGDDDTGMWRPDNNTIAFSTNSSERVRIEGSFVGINRSAPRSVLHVETNSSQSDYGTNGAAGNQGITLINSNGSNNLPIGIQFGGSSGYVFGGLYGVMTTGANGTAGDLTFALRQNSSSSSFTEAMRIVAGGNIGIGTISPQSTLHVPDGKYAQFEDNNAGAPPSGDCDSDTERGRMSIDTTNNRLYICNGATRGWDYVGLTD